LIYAAYTSLDNDKDGNLKKYNDINAFRSDSDILEIMSGNKSFFMEAEKLFNNGSNMWIYWKEGKIAAKCWSSNNLKSSYLLPLSKNDIVLYAFYVMHEFRGQGLYTKMLKKLAGYFLSAEAVKSCYIDCKSWNLPSKKGIEKAGFKFLGSAIRLDLAGKSWVVKKNMVEIG
jgi:RimJ/RimL family protein N-acetyltransferase